MIKIENLSKTYDIGKNNAVKALERLGIGMFADEPTGALDSKSSQEIIQVFQELNSQGATIIIVTHDMEIARNCSRIIEIKDGKIKE